MHNEIIDNLDQREKVIIWQKWSDPYAQDIEEEISEEDEDSYEYEESLEEDNPELDYAAEKVNKFRAIATPMGIIPINETTASGKIFNFWVGHTNFDITNAIGLLIEESAGVETLDIFTRYRFRIGIGKAFNDSQVMRNINKTVYEYLL